MELMAEATTGHAKHACYRCLNPSPVVDMDVVIEGEGTLALCPNCLTDGMNAALRRLPSDPVVMDNARLREELAANEDVVTQAEQVVSTLITAWKRMQTRKRKEREAEE